MVSEEDLDGDRTLEQFERDREARHRALMGQEALVAETSSILFHADPIGINFGMNTDEYDSEAESIIFRVTEADGPAALQRICHEEFVRWFWPEIAGPLDRYEQIAHQIWDAVERGHS